MRDTLQAGHRVRTVVGHNHGHTGVIRHITRIGRIRVATVEFDGGYTGYNTTEDLHRLYRSGDRVMDTTSYSHGSAAGRAITLYTGRQLRTLQRVADPSVRHTHAFKAVFEPDDAPGRTLSAQELASLTAFFLVREVPEHAITEDDLEEVKFTAWPPTAVL